MRPSRMQIRKSDFLFAMDRLEDFRAVHSGEGMDDKIDAISIMLESLGITDAIEIDIMRFLHDKGGHGQEGGYLLGIILGIIAYRNMTEREM